MIGEAFRRFKHRRRLEKAKAEIRSRPRQPGAAHGLPDRLIVSLTSYPARFGTLGLTLRALLTQSVSPDRMILWLDPGDGDKLPQDVLELVPRGLDIRECPNWRSFKKIVPTLLDEPDAHIATADDDVYYPRDWLKGLVHAVAGGADIACYRAHRVVLDRNGRPASYRDWKRNISTPETSGLVFLTGVSGVLYRPGVFHPDVTNADLFSRLAPSTDDVWLYWMHRLNGIKARKIGGKVRILEWDGSQAQSLRAGNLVGQGNDEAVAAMMQHYGWPRE
jgi:hypothetical protein